MKKIPCNACNGTGLTIDQTALGKQMRKLREKKKISLRTMATLMDVSAPFLSDLELGKRNWTPAKIASFQKNLSFYK